MWSVPDGELLARLAGHEDRVQAIAVGPQDLVVSGSFDRRAAVWPHPRRTAVSPFPELSGSIRTAAFHGDDRIVTGHEDGRVLIWTIPDYEQIASLEGHGDRVTTILIPPHGEWLAKT